jgi:hypothetical protein
MEWVTQSDFNGRFFTGHENTAVKFSAFYPVYEIGLFQKTRLITALLADVA